MTRSEFARALGIPPKERAEMRDAIRSLESAGKVQRFKRGRYGIPVAAQERGDMISGTIRFPSPDRGRNGSLELDEASRKKLKKLGDLERLFVSARFAGTALPGDRVTATVQKRAAPKWHKHVKRHRDKMNRPGEQRFDARVVSIEERRRTHFIGTLNRNKQFAHVVPDDAIFQRNFEVNPDRLPPGAIDGKKVLVKLTSWESPYQSPKGRVTKVLGNPGDAGVDILSIIYKHDLPLEFPDRVVEEAKSIEESVTAEEIESREDWRDELVYTIDPFDARDFDDAICVKPLEGGGWQLAVFIADVAHYVTPGSELDKEARRRGNSVYLVDRVIPMLPVELSNGICSLNPDVDRLTHAVIMEFDAKGNRNKARFAKTIIRSQKRYSYEEAYAIMKEPRPKKDKSEDSILGNALHDAWDLASQIRDLRMNHGSLDLDFPEVKVILDESGTPTELRVVEYDESHQLIEEFMLSANEAVAELTKNWGASSVYRIHEDPDLDKLFEFRELARSYHYDVGDLSLRTEIQKLLKAIRGKPEEHALKIGFLKSLKRAAYSEVPLGHYGLAKVNYTHFTSPIRRYADLVVHRVLERLETSKDKQTRNLRTAEITEVAEHLSTTERTAADAENESKLLKQFEYFLNMAKRNDQTTFAAVVTEILPRGIFIELTNYYLRGMIRREDLPRREVYLDPQSQRVTNDRGKVILSPGNTVQVRIRRVDIERKFLDFVFDKLPG